MLTQKLDMRSRRVILTVPALALTVAAVADADAEARHASRRGR